jgi:copper chaperone
MRTTTFPIKGMHCDGCAETVRALLERQMGVRGVTVSFHDGQARVLYDPQEADEAHLIATIQKSGYRVVRQV